MILPSFLLLLAVFTAGEAFREAKDEEFPFQVSVQNMDKWHLCGGAIIAPKWILTASSCVKYDTSVLVSYGSADSNRPLDSIPSLRIERQSLPTFRSKNSLALIELQRAVQFSKTAQQAKLPTSKVQLRNTTKLSGWNVHQTVNVPPNLYVSDKYLVIPKDCVRSTGTLVTLGADEFCGMDEESQNMLFNPGSIVSKSAIVLGILPSSPLAASEPYIYVKTSEYEQWIKDTLLSDAQYVSWANDVPTDSALENCVISLSLLAFSAIFTSILA